VLRSISTAKRAAALIVLVKTSLSRQSSPRPRSLRLPARSGTRWGAGRDWNQAVTAGRCEPTELDPEPRNPLCARHALDRPDQSFWK
jgi:hypothetical protein